MPPPYLISVVLDRLLRVRGSVVPAQRAWRRAVIARTSGLKREEMLGDYEWWQGHGPRAIEHWRVLEKAEPARAQWPLRIAQALKEGGDFDAAERTLHDARDRRIEGETLELDLLRYARMSRSSNSAIADAEAIVADPHASGDKVFYAAYHLVAQNRLDTARTGLERLKDSAKFRATVRGYLAAVEILARAKANGRPELPGRLSSSQNSVLVREPSSDTLVVGFALGEGTLGLPVNAAHAMLSSAGVNGLYLYDSRHVYHLSGTDRFGPGYAAMIEGIRALAAELGTRRLVTVGGSATGYTALRTAVDLDADGAIVFSPSTLMFPHSKPEIARGAYNLVRLKQHALSMMEDPRRRLQQRKSVPRIDVYYSARNTRDIMHASNLVGIKGIRLHPVEGLGRHDSLTELAARGYHDLLDGLTT
jgi:hypothetical protein